MENEIDPPFCQIHVFKGRGDALSSGQKAFKQNCKIFLLRRFRSLLENHVYALCGSRWINLCYQNCFYIYK